MADNPFQNFLQPPPQPAWAMPNMGQMPSMGSMPQLGQMGQMGPMGSLDRMLAQGKVDYLPTVRARIARALLEGLPSLPSLPSLPREIG
jgi:hypothetical protein